MTAKNDGGPAFPSVLYSHERAENWSTDGMTLRDWFAGQGIPAAVARSEEEAFETGSDLAAYLYEFADAMIAARSK